MKKLVGISLFLFWAIVTATLTAGLVFYQDSQRPTNALATNGNTAGDINTANGDTVALDVQSISRHNSSSDCWIIINNKVYNVTKYLGDHPGGASAISPYCGKDATRAFATRNRDTPHSAFAQSLLDNFYIGGVN